MTAPERLEITFARRTPNHNGGIQMHFSQTGFPNKERD